MSLLLNSDIGNRWSPMSHFVGAKAPHPFLTDLKKFEQNQKFRNGLHNELAGKISRAKNFCKCKVMAPLLGL